MAAAVLTAAGATSAAAEDGGAGSDTAVIAAADGGTIAGTVTAESDGQPLGGVSVIATGSSTPSTTTTFTDENGDYVLEGLAADEYLVRFAPADLSLATEYWDGAYALQDATTIAVDEGVARTGIDASLLEVATVSGTVTRESDGSPVAGSVEVLSDAGYWSASIEPDGSYSVAVAPGAHLVHFSSADDTAASEYWEDAASYDDATPITVAPGESRGGLDAELSSRAAITGTVFVGGVPLTDSVIVEAWSDGEIAGMAYTQSDGTYRIALPAGDYTLRAGETQFGIDWGIMFYPDARTLSESTTVTLGSTVDTPDIDFTLEPGADIQGTVTASGASLPAGGATVTALLWSSGEWREVATVQASGAYRFGSDDPFIAQESGPLPAGEYRIRVEAPGFCTRYSGGATSLESATSIQAAVGATFRNINVVLTPSCDAPAPSLTLSVGSVRAGGAITVTGAGFSAGETVAFELHSDPLALGSLTADQSGRISGTLRIPASAPVGAHTLVALGAGASIQASVALQVTAAATGGAAGAATGPDRLAATGAEIPAVPLFTGLVLAVLGAALMRRRRAHG
ncbi:carboxypeptidase regulatory-like domain-containing protein [Microbacterium sp. NPDC089695]|uniref:carboxypeptidase regulatory-like domain-containing protein n=1 Tax=Microbacterium sp. NPDC089695 TaxID=3364198 RepID=UPI0038121640